MAVLTKLLQISGAYGSVTITQEAHDRVGYSSLAAVLDNCRNVVVELDQPAKVTSNIKKWSIKEFIDYCNQNPNLEKLLTVTPAIPLSEAKQMQSILTGLGYTKDNNGLWVAPKDTDNE